MILLTHPKVSYDVLEFQPGDGLNLLRKLPIIGDFVPDNVQPTIKMVGRRNLSTVDIQLEGNETMNFDGDKVNIELGGYKFFGLFPTNHVEDGERIYTCHIDYFELSDKVEPICL